MDIYKYGFKQISKQNMKEFFKNLQGGHLVPPLGPYRVKAT